jgi:hypothetical protein
MNKAEKFFAGEMAMRLSGASGFQWCMFPCNGEPCYELLWPGAILEVAHYGKRLFVCPHHKELYQQLQRPIEEIWAPYQTPLLTQTSEQGSCLVGV